jgi:hypothetical protein
MSSLLLMRPMPISQITASRGSGVTRLLTDDPKEAFLDSAVASALTINVDLGSVQTIDSVFLGYTNADPACVWTVTSGVPTYGGTTWASGANLPAPYRITRRPRHGFLHLVDPVTNLAAPVSARYIRFVITQPAGALPLYAGVVAVGQAIQPIYGHEYGSGRTPIDTATRERLVSGGFGIGPGIVKSSWDWTMGDLTDDELNAIYDVAMTQGESHGILVVENPDVTLGLAERIHWGVFDKLESYQRLIPGATSWAMRIEDWI